MRKEIGVVKMDHDELGISCTCGDVSVVKSDLW